MAAQFTHADHLDILCVKNALRFASADFFRDDPRWTFAGDFNCDGLIIISDLWFAAGWFFFLPGDFAVFAVLGWRSSLSSPATTMVAGYPVFCHSTSGGQ